MKDLRRRDFLKCRGLEVLCCIPESPCRALRKAYAEDIKEVNLSASITPIDIGSGRTFKAWTYNGKVPGLRSGKGRADAPYNPDNNLPGGTTTHWHGLLRS